MLLIWSNIENFPILFNHFVPVCLSLSLFVCLFVSNNNFCRIFFSNFSVQMLEILKHAVLGMPYSWIYFCKTSRQLPVQWRLCLFLALIFKQISVKARVSQQLTITGARNFNTLFVTHSIAWHTLWSIFVPIGSQLPVKSRLCLYSHQSWGITSEHWLTYILFCKVHTIMQE